MDGIEITGPVLDRFEEILTPEALAFVATLQRELGARRLALLDARATRQAELSAGGTLGFPAETRPIREDDTWRVADPAPGLEDRRVEITGPVDKKMTINALNSGAKVWLADFEDANSPLWENCVSGHLNLRDALDRTIDFPPGEGLHAAPGRGARHDRRPAPRLAPGREAPPGRRRPGLGVAVRLRALLLPLRAAPARRGPRAVLLSAQDRVVP